MEVQAHGNSYENDVIMERTGYTKDEYDALKGGGLSLIHISEPTRPY